MEIQPAVKQRRKEAPVPEKKHVKLRLTELPRAAAALLSGKSPEDERTVLAFERGFAFCALLGFAYYGICLFLTVWCPYLFFNFFCMCAAPVLLGIVKLRENILTPPRAAHIRLNTKSLLLRLPVYALAAFPFFFIAVFYPTVYDTMGHVGDGQIKISESYLSLKQFEQAEEILGSIVELIFKQKFNNANQETIYRYATYFYTYGVVLLKLNRLNNAKIYFNKVLEIINGFLLPNDPWIININDLIKICDSKKIK